MRCPSQRLLRHSDSSQGYIDRINTRNDALCLHTYERYTDYSLLGELPWQHTWLLSAMASKQLTRAS